MVPHSASTKLFVYGSLMSPEVVQTLLGRLPRSVKKPSFLYGFSRHPVRRQPFPALVSSATDRESKVDGILYEDLTHRELKCFDWFEGDEYKKSVVDVFYNNGDDDSTESKTAAFVYVWDCPLEELDLSASWSYERFQEAELESYIENVVKPCRREIDQLPGFNY